VLAMMVNEQTSFTNAMTLKKLCRLSSVNNNNVNEHLFSNSEAVKVTSMLRCYCSQLAVYVGSVKPLNEADSKASQNINTLSTHPNKA
jgi:hypothetical protein